MMLEKAHFSEKTFFFLNVFWPITDSPAFEDQVCLHPWAPAYISKHSSHTPQSHLSSHPPPKHKYFIADDHFNGSQDNVSETYWWHLKGSQE